MLFVRLVLSLVSSPRVQEVSGREKMVLIAVKAMPAGSNPPADVGVRISTGEKHDFGATAPFATMTSSLQGRAGGSMESSPELVRHIGGSASTLFAEQLSPCFA